MKNENKKRKNSKSNSGAKKANSRRIVRTNKNPKRVTFTQNQIKQFYQEFLNEEKNYSKKKRSSNSRRPKKNRAAKAVRRELYSSRMPRLKRTTKTKKSKRSYYRQSKLTTKDWKLKTIFLEDKPVVLKVYKYRLSSTNFIDIKNENGTLKSEFDVKKEFKEKLFSKMKSKINRLKKWPKKINIVIEYFDGLDFLGISNGINDLEKDDFEKAANSLIEEVYATLPQYLDYLSELLITGFHLIIYPQGIYE